MRLKDKIALVTGGAGGIGGSIADRFCREGAHVVVIDRDDGRIASKVEELTRNGHSSEGLALDLTDVAKIAPAFQAIAARHGTIDILVNSAGAFINRSIEETTEADWDLQNDVNLKAVFFACQAAIGVMRSSGSGKIVNISSISGMRASPNCAAYCASKGGVINLTRALAFEVASKGINVNSVAPGNTETKMNEHLRVGPEGEALSARLRELTPSGVDFLKPTDIANATVFLASDDANAVHGVTIAVDGGWTTW